MIMKNLMFTAGRVLLTFSMTGCAAVLGWHLWSFYMEAPWTRDAHVRADIIRLAPDVSGPVAEVLVSDNAQVEKGTPLFRIETDRFELALREAEAQVTATRAAAELAKTDFERYQLLASKEAASLKERQYAESRMYQAEAAYQSALVARDLARLNLERTTVRAPASGAITNFSLRRGNYVVSGNAVGALVEEESVYVAGYFEETKLPRIHIGDPVTISIMGEAQSVTGRVAGIAAGIEDRERSDNAGSLASVAPTFSWVRLAQRIPVRIEIDDAPKTVRLVAGRTATVSIEQRSNRVALRHPLPSAITP
ncbi:RND family efflux transporter MFP subunit [Agrobacterium pusense]|jgi:RND family efflux transporter MFP subunit|uniref:Multidrug resistance membrane protein (MFP family) n=2 Tax=Agrobacterium pusense TaxID=648995 RepID=U4Q3Q4_9HYPH|nr:RND family efflux transporter MFP subunit [Agrobacterium pusense]CDI10663.1 putative multidrug resistance membrane protein (MFP family) [Agrobacterium pusense]